MRIIRDGDCRTTPWKNGGGSTTEIAVSPEGASLDTFDWRISMAQVAADGPFSAFAGIDRSLAVIEGRGMVLTIGEETPVTLETHADPISFAGDTQTFARLTDGVIVDLNVMTRRERFSHRMRRIADPTSCDLAGGDIAVVLSLKGGTTIESETCSATLNHGDAAVMASATLGFRIIPGGDCYLILLREHRG